MNKILITIAFVFVAVMTVSCKKDVARKTAEDAPSSQNKYVESVANEHLAADSLVCDTVFHEVDSLRADSSSVDTCSFGLTLRKTWIFDYSEESFPTEHAVAVLGMCILKGFAVEADSIFYIMGGNPAVIAKYSGTSQIARKELGLNLQGSYGAFLQIRGDSLYFIDEQDQVIYSLDKNLRSIEAFQIPLAPEDSIVYGKMEQDSYVLLTRIRDSDETLGGNYSTWRFEYPCKNGEKYVNDNDWRSHLSAYTPLNESGRYFIYQGNIGDYRIFLDPPLYEEASIIVADASGESLFEDSFKHLPPLATASGQEEHYGAMQSELLRVISNGKLYMTGYKWDPSLFYIQEYSIFR